MALTPARQMAAKALLGKKPAQIGKGQPVSSQPIKKPTPPQNTLLGRPGVVTRPVGPYRYNSMMGKGPGVPGARFARQTVKPRRTVRVGPAVKRMMQ